MNPAQAEEIRKRRPLTKWEKIALANYKAPPAPPKMPEVPLVTAERLHTASGEALVAKQLAAIEAKPKPVPAPAKPRPPLTPLEERLERERQLREMEKARDLRLAELQQRIDYWEEHRRFAERSARRMREVAADASGGLALYGGEETVDELLARQDRGYR